MKFTCHKNVILKEISIAQDIISSRNSLSILSNVLLEADNGILKIKATDLKVSFETQIPVEVIQAGSTTVYCDKFLGIIRSLPEGDVEFNLADGRLLINPVFGKINFQLKSIASEKFPEIQEIEDDKYFELSQNSLIDMISQTIFSVSDDETRYFMNGVYLEHQEGSLSMVATDGRRLSFIKKDLDTEIKDFDAVIIPTKILHLIKKLASGEGNLYLAVSEKSIFVKFDNQKLSSNLIEGQFP
ncbi:MAG: DNA polymerase III subunit beta, partial [Spirochaetales bacterium]|nr:DNA polymerase III subunit beta [Spirochaetales bacterium]